MRTLAIATFAIALLGTSTALADTITNNTTNNTTTVNENKYECTNCNIVVNPQQDSRSAPQTIPFSICNRSPSRIGLAVGYPIVSADNDWRFKGWFYLAPGTCHTEQVDAAGRTETSFAFHAYNTNSLKVWGNEDVKIALPDSKFEFVLYEHGGAVATGTQYDFVVKTASINDKNVWNLGHD